MSTGIGRFLRLKSAIDATVRDLGDRSMAAAALLDAYARFRPEARALARDAGTLDEFDRLFPEATEGPTFGGRLSNGFDPIHASQSAKAARGLLVQLSGWLDGFVQEMRETSGGVE